MTRYIKCVVLNAELEALDEPPYPGELGERICKEVSKDGWRMWLERLAAIINENGLSTLDEEAMTLIEAHMVGFLFDEGDMGQLPEGFQPNK